jgi:SAM-dependent methyltransferase
MSQQKPLDENTAVQFYEDRYQHGYMNDWPADKKGRICEVVRELPLAPEGDALDFGCGNGVLTEAIRCALPSGWRVFGSDISSVAIENARSRFPACQFYSPGDTALTGKKFDLIFTHHVLEHVINLGSTIELMDSLLKDRAAMFHILPCGNPGSLEYRLATLRRGGIDPNLENRFFYEDEGHVRRLTTEQLVEELKAQDFRLTREYYNVHHHGAIEWITDYGEDVVQEITDPSQAIDSEAAKELDKLRVQLMSIYRMRHRARQYRHRLSKRDKTWKNYAFLLLNAPIFALARAVDASCKQRSRKEWAALKGQRNGSEMFVFFQRESRLERADASGNEARFVSHPGRQLHPITSWPTPLPASRTGTRRPTGP